MKLKTLVRVGTGLVVAVATSAVLHATMTSHEANLYGDSGGLACDAAFDEIENQGAILSTRSITISLRGPSGEVLDWNAYGTSNDAEPIFLAAVAGAVGPGTYSCRVVFEQRREWEGLPPLLETEEWNDTLEVY